MQQQTMKYLNDKAVADAILAKNKDHLVDPVFMKLVRGSIRCLSKKHTE